MRGSDGGWGAVRFDPVEDCGGVCGLPALAPRIGDQPFFEDNLAIAQAACGWGGGQVPGGGDCDLEFLPFAAGDDFEDAGGGGECGSGAIEFHGMGSGWWCVLPGVATDAEYIRGGVCQRIIWNFF